MPLPSDRYTWADFILDLERRYGVERGVSAEVPYLRRRLPDGTVREKSLFNVSPTREIHRPTMESVLLKLGIDPAEFERI